MLAAEHGAGGAVGAGASLAGSPPVAAQGQQQLGQGPHHVALVALLTAVPFAVAAGAMVLNARLAARANERHRHAGEGARDLGRSIEGGAWE